MTPLLFLDTETTGLRPGRHTPWEIAWQIGFPTLDGESITIAPALSGEYFIRLTDLELIVADRTALSIGKFEERYEWEKAVAPATALAALKESIKCARLFLGSNTVSLVGAVPSFDHAMICGNWTGWPGFNEGLWHYHLVDVEALMAGALHLQPPWNSKELSSRFGIEVSKDREHTAMGDVMWAIDCYAAAMDLRFEWLEGSLLTETGNK